MSAPIWLQRAGAWFGIEQRGSTAMREVVAGFTTFGAMSYILAVNPAILSAAGMDYAQLVIVTALASALGTLIMALWANLPVALAPGMGNNVIFAQIVVLRMGVSYRVALAMVFVNALLFVALALSGWRGRIIRGFPAPLRIGVQCSLGLFIAWLGLKNSGLLVLGRDQLSFAALNGPATIFTYAAILVTLMLVAARVPVALLASIVGISLLGLIVPDGSGGYVTHVPAHLLAWPVAPRQLFMAIDLRGLVAQIGTVFPVLLYLFISDFFGLTATLLGVTRPGGLAGPDGEIPNGRQAYAADGTASAAGALLGTSTVGAYVESAAGVAAGGRTGLTAIVVAMLFLASIFAWPMLSAVPPQAVAPALIVVGVMMLEGLQELDMSGADNLFPALVMVIIAGCTTDLVMSLASGCFLYSGILIATRQYARLTGVVVFLNVAFIVYIVLASRI